MNEIDVIYRYANAESKAKSMGLSLAATRSDFVLRDVTRGNQEFARTTTLGAIEEALDARAEMLRSPGSTD
jgi:hypothetical protein